MGNGLMAIVAGLFAQLLVSNFSLGPVAPFDAAAAVMLAGGLVVLSTWSENYGDSSNKTSLQEQAVKAGKAIIAGISCFDQLCHTVWPDLLVVALVDFCYNIPQRCSSIQGAVAFEVQLFAAPEIMLLHAQLV